MNQLGDHHVHVCCVPLSTLHTCTCMLSIIIIYIHVHLLHRDGGLTFKHSPWPLVCVLLHHSL